MADSEQLPAWLTEGCVNFYANEFGRSRFVSGLNWYRNIDRNWELTAPRAACYRSGALCRRRPGPCCPLSQRARANRKPQKVCPDLRKTIMSPGCAIGRSRATGRAQCALLAFPRGV